MSTDHPSSVHYLDGIAIGPDLIFFACQLDALDSSETAHTRMSNYNPAGSQDSAFGFFDLEDNIVSVHAYRTLPEDKKRFVCLGRHGDVHFVRGSTREVRTEKIPGAGMVDGNFGGLLSHLREIDGQLWACGQHGQIYRRRGTDDWVRADEGVRVWIDPARFRDRSDEMLELMSSAPMLSCVDGSSLSDVYVVGMNGYMAYFDGDGWTQVELPTQDHLEWIRCYGPSEVWVCGYNGALLKGNVREGFKRMSGNDDSETFVCLTKFNGKVYLSAEEGLFIFDGKKVAPVKTKLKPELQDAWRVDHADGVLWSIGVKDLARFDGKRWQRIQDPDNEVIGA